MRPISPRPPFNPEHRHRHHTHTSRVCSRFRHRVASKDGESAIQCSLSAASACEDLSLLTGTPAALAQFDG